MNCPPESASHASPALNLRRATASASVGGRVGVGGAGGVVHLVVGFIATWAPQSLRGEQYSPYKIYETVRENTIRSGTYENPKLPKLEKESVAFRYVPKKLLAYGKRDKKINPNHSNRNDQCDYCEHKYYDCYFTLFVSTLTLLRGRVS